MKMPKNPAKISWSMSPAIPSWARSPLDDPTLLNSVVQRATCDGERHFYSGYVFISVTTHTITYKSSAI